MCKLDRDTEILYCIFQVKILNCQCHPCFLPGTCFESYAWMYRRDECSVFGDGDGLIRLIALRSIIAGVVRWFWRSFMCCMPKFLWRFSQSGCVPRHFGNRSWVEDTSVRSCRVFYGHFNDIPAQKLRDLQIYRGRFCNFLKTWEFVAKTLQKKVKSLLLVLAYFPCISVLMCQYYLSCNTYHSGEYCNLRWCCSGEKCDNWAGHTGALKKASMYPVNDHHWTEVVG